MRWKVTSSSRFLASSSSCAHLPLRMDCCMPAPLPSSLESMGSGNTGWAEAVLCSHPLPFLYAGRSHQHSCPGWSRQRWSPRGCCMSICTLDKMCRGRSIWMLECSQQQEAELSKRKGTGFAKSRRYLYGHTWFALCYTSLALVFHPECHAVL